MRILGRDAGGQRHRLIADGTAERCDLAHVNGLAGGNARGAHRIHEAGGEPRCVFIMLRRHLALLLEAGAASIEPAPAGGRQRCGNILGLNLVIRRPPLVHARVVRPVAVDGNAIALQLAQHRESILPRHRKEVHAHPQGRKCLPHMRDDGQEALHAEIMVDEEAAGRPLFHEHAHVAHGLFIVRHVDHRQHRRPHALEQLFEFVPFHGPKITALCELRKFIMMMQA